MPGLTDGEENLSAIAALLRELSVSEIHLLAYHAMGEAKLPRLGMPIPPLELGRAARSGDHLERARSFMRAQGLEVRG